MTRERWRRIQDLFYSAADLPPDRRADYLHDACAGDESLVRHVEDLIASEREADGFLDGALRESASSMVGARAGDRIGPYRIKEELGHGGMGDVYLAERDDQQFQKQVAIKLIRSGAAPERLLARFRAERQILATLEHPNIARLLDGGTSGSSPYLVMEYVSGEAIDRYCARHALSIRDRLQLFRSVCEAVAYAHRSLIIHRDIKPSNILVTAEGVPKLLDFGIAKLVKEDIEADGLTRPLERAMTPAYASPEVVRGERVTTAADVYSLGALLYELLTERAPFHLTSSQAAEVERVVCLQEPPKPGTVDNRLRGDLENIIGMAMHKEAARRYASVEQFIADLDRYLTGYPVAARSDRLYRWAKFARRNRAGLAAGVLAAAGITGWVISLKAEQARTRQGFAQVRELAESLLFETDDALRPVAGATAAREAIVKRGLKYLDGLASQDAGDPRFQDELADAYERVADIQFTSTPNLGQPAGALDSCRKAVAIRQALAQSQTRNIPFQRKLARTYLKLSQAQNSVGDLSGSDESFRQANAILDQVSRAAPGDPSVHRDLGMAYLEGAHRQINTDRFAGARQMSEKALAEGRSALQSKPGDPGLRNLIAESEITLILALMEKRRDLPPALRSEVLEHYREAERVRTQLAADFPNDSGQRLGLSDLYQRACGLTGLLPPREQLTACRKATALCDDLAGDDPANISARANAIGTHHNLAGRMFEMHEEGALSEIRRSTELADALLAERPDVGSIRSHTAFEHQGYADLLRKSGDPAAAVDQMHRSLQIREPGLLNPKDPRARVEQGRGYLMLGELEMQQGHRPQAMAAWDEAGKLLDDPRDIERLHQLREGPPQGRPGPPPGAPGPHGPPPPRY
jgi:tRNA A-37 threonylcarbamoyl transferase component Bud32/tetratricopeptide (TPR) repeat protein